MYNPKLAICALAKNEQYYINDWVRYHLDMGIDHIYLYDNNDWEDVENFIDKEYLERITIIDIHGKVDPQHSSYTECFRSYKHLYDWMIFIDIDEFICMRCNKTLKQLLSNEQYLQFDAIVVNWCVFSDSGQIYGDLSVPVWERFTEKSIVNDEWQHTVKSFVNCRTSNDVYITCHFPYTNDNKLVKICSPNLSIPNPIQFQNSGFFVNIDSVETSLITINHYITKTVSEFRLHKFNRTDASCSTKPPPTDNYFWIHNVRNKDKEYIMYDMSLDELKYLLLHKSSIV